jgi:ammonia channel protein AmtB
VIWQRRTRMEIYCDPSPECFFLIGEAPRDMPDRVAVHEWRQCLAVIHVGRRDVFDSEGDHRRRLDRAVMPSAVQVSEPISRARIGRLAVGALLVWAGWLFSATSHKDAVSFRAPRSPAAGFAFVQTIHAATPSAAAFCKVLASH